METTLTRDSITTLAITIIARVASGEVGMTIDWNGEDLKPKNALVVGGVTRSLKVNVTEPLERTLLAIDQWLTQNSDRKSYAPIGVWSENGEIHFDLVTVLPMKENYGELGDHYMAHNLAAARGELAYGEFDSHGCYIETHTL